MLNKINFNCQESKLNYDHRNRGHRNHQPHEPQRQSRSTVDEDRIEIYNTNNIVQQQLKQSSRPVKPGPPTKPKPNVALSRKSSKKYFDIHSALTRFNQTMICIELG